MQQLNKAAIILYIYVCILRMPNSCSVQILLFRFGTGIFKLVFLGAIGICN